MAKTRHAAKSRRFRAKAAGATTAFQGVKRATALTVRGARTHNLKNVSLKIPHNSLTVLTGVSGSGKSSLAFDTIFAEGQRQYIDGLSTYARQFLNQLQRADVDRIDGLQPTLCIDQRVGIANPRSTVATITEVYDFLRLLMARVAIPSCFKCGAAIEQQSTSDILRRLSSLPDGTKLVIMAPIVRQRKGTHRDVLAEIEKAGLIKVRIDGEMLSIDETPALAQRKNHTIEAVVDRIVLRPSSLERLSDSIATAIELAKGLVTVSHQLPVEDDGEANENPWRDDLFSTLYSCAACGASFEEIEPRTFSFNSPLGACPACEGMGSESRFDQDLIYQPLPGKKLKLWFAALPGAAEALQRKVDAAVARALIRAGLKPNEVTDKLAAKPLAAALAEITLALEAIHQASDAEDSDALSTLRSRLDCLGCGGSRLRPEALSIRLAGKSIADLTRMSIAAALEWFENLEVTESKLPIATPILNEMLHRLRFLNKVGVGYLTLARAADTLSGGELQRVRLATCIGNGLVGVTYILDEPSIGLHQRDNDRLIDSLRDLKRNGNTVIVVEHDESMMRAADQLVDIGPGAGLEGGEVVVEGPPEVVQAHATSLTAAYLDGRRKVFDRGKVRKPKKGYVLRLVGATLHNLKNQTVEVPLGLLVGITGVSGSGKSSLISKTLLPALGRAIGQRQVKPGPFRSLSGVENVDKLVEITQAPIGRSPRSTPATYCGVFDLIRSVWANTRESKQRGYTLSRFSFNSGAGRCAECQGQGQQRIEMNFLPNIFVNCPACGGSRFNKQTLRVRYRGHSIADVLEMSVDEASVFFENFAKINRLLVSLQQVGLGYLKLGQSSITLSGGESQRIKLATELARPETGKTVYFLDEPTTGLHFEDVRRLLNVLDGLVERGNSVIVIEHNLDVIRACDWLVDVGPDGGDNGGRVVAQGSPSDLAASPDSLTGRFI